MMKLTQGFKGPVQFITIINSRLIHYDSKLRNRKI